MLCQEFVCTFICDCYHCIYFVIPTGQYTAAGLTTRGATFLGLRLPVQLL